MACGAFRCRSHPCTLLLLLSSTAILTLNPPFGALAQAPPAAPWWYIRGGPTPLGGTPAENLSGGALEVPLLLARPLPAGPVPVLDLIPATEAFPVCQTPGITNLTISGKALRTTTWKGWGTSLAWFANYIGALPLEPLTQLLDLMFDPVKGLGLNIVRYNIGGGYNPLVSTQFNVTGPLGFYGIPGFKPTADGPYDWSADAPQRAVLLGARDRGADTFIAFSNSPPWWMTNSGDVAGARVPYSSNMNPRFYAAFADYLTEVVRRYATDPSWNITFTSLEPFNEAREGPWTAGFNQEGCHMNIEDIAAIIPLVHHSLLQKGLRTRLVGIDSWADLTVSAFQALKNLTRATTITVTNTSIDISSNSTGSNIATLRNITSSSGAFPSNSTIELTPVFIGPPPLSLLTQYHLHAYVFPSIFTSQPLSPALSLENSFTAARQLAQQAGRELWVSEWCALWRFGGQIDLALLLARTVMESVNIMGASAWVYWQAINGAPASWTLIDIPWNYTAPFEALLHKNYWVMKQLTSAVPPGSLPIDISPVGGCHHSVAAFYVPARRQLVVLLNNQQPVPYDLPLTLTDFRPVSDPAGKDISGSGSRGKAGEVRLQMFRTSFQENVAPVLDQTLPLPTRVTTRLEGLSFTTVLISEVVPV